MSKGLILGSVMTKPTRLEGIRALLDRALPAGKAVQIGIQALRQKEVRKFVRLNEVVHSAAFSPSGGGKGAGLCIPFLLTCPESAVVIDFKGELARASASARRAMGHEIVIIDPMNVLGGTDSYNVLGALSPDDPLTLDHCNTIGNALVVRTGNEPDPHWNDRAEAFISTICAAAVAMAAPGDRNLQAVRRTLTNEARLKAVLQHCCRSDAFGGMLARAARDLSRLADKELASVMSTVGRHTRFLDSVPIEGVTTTSTFDPAAVLTGKMTIYIVLPPEHMRAQAGFLRLVIGAMLQAVVKGGLQEKNKVHFVLDESASLGKLDIIEDALDKYRGYGIHLQFYYQSLGQLKKCWGEGGDQTLLSNTTQIFFGVNDLPTAEYVSSRLGEFTQVVTSGGTNESTSHQGTGEQKSRSYSYGSNSGWQQAARKLLQPAEVLGLDPRICIAFPAGMPPVALWLTRYYEEDYQPARGIGPIRAFVDAAALLTTTVILAVISTAVVFNIK